MYDPNNCIIIIAIKRYESPPRRVYKHNTDWHLFSVIFNNIDVTIRKKKHYHIITQCVIPTHVTVYSNNMLRVPLWSCDTAAILNPENSDEFYWNSNNNNDNNLLLLCFSTLLLLLLLLFLTTTTATALRMTRVCPTRQSHLPT